MKVISYYTRNTLYEKEAEQLRLSCERVGLPYRIEGIDPFGKWHEHVCYKPSFILQKMEELKAPVLWIDADGEVVQKPLFDRDCDLSLRIFDHFPSSHPSYLFAATVYLNYTPSTLKLVKRWSDLCQKGIKENPGIEVSDQVFLQMALEEMKGKIKLKPLPKGCSALFEETIPSDELYIVQYQASRLYRKFINGEVISFGAFDALSVDELRKLRPKLNT